jgi:hypothetical protein
MITGWFEMYPGRLMSDEFLMMAGQNLIACCQIENYCGSDTSKKRYKNDEWQELIMGPLLISADLK